MKQNKKKTAFLPCKIFKHDGATLTVGVSETTINDKPAPQKCISSSKDMETEKMIPKPLPLSRQTERWRSLRPY